MRFSLSRVIVIVVIIGCFNGTEESCAAVDQKSLRFFSVNLRYSVIKVCINRAQIKSDGTLNFLPITRGSYKADKKKKNTEDDELDMTDTRDYLNDPESEYSFD